MMCMLVAVLSSTPRYLYLLGRLVLRSERDRFRSGAVGRKQGPKVGIL
jgi:hypothetical protein